MRDFENLIKSNLHTHTNFCDGADSPEDIVKSAISLGMETVGFSGHSFTPIDTSYCMSEEKTVQYVSEIERLNEIYGDRINILCGIEMDLFGKRPNRVFDYVIGSAHYVQLGGEYCPVDMGAEKQKEDIRRYCAGNPYQYVRAYFQNVARIPDTLPQCDVVAHFDLVSKYNEKNALFDENDPRFLNPACEALDYLIERGMMVEINTGAILRGYRTFPYPTGLLMRRIAQKGGRVTLGSDAHRKEHLLGFFSRALGHLYCAGIGEVYSMTKNGWTPMSLY